MKQSSLPKSIFIGTVLLSLFSFLYVNAHSSCGTPVPAEVKELLQTRQEDESQPADSRLPDVTVLGFLLKLAGKFLPIAN